MQRRHEICRYYLLSISSLVAKEMKNACGILPCKSSDVISKQMLKANRL